MKLYNKITLGLLFVAAAMLIQSCTDDSTGPDFSAVPEPFNRSAAVSDSTFDNGLQIFVIDQGDGPFEVNPNDQIQLRYTGRTEDGEIFDTTFRPNSSTDQSAIFRNLTPTAQPGQSTLIEGFRKGLVGMKEGEERIIEIPPSLGYSDAQRGTNGFDLRENTLIFDVELVRIF